MKKISIDLSTLSGWQDLTYNNEYSFVVKAKASGRQDSDDSEIFKITKQLPSGVETWIINDPLEDLHDIGDVHLSLIFTSNNTTFNYFSVLDDGGLYVTYEDGSHAISVHDPDKSTPWLNQAYRTITFDTELNSKVLSSEDGRIFMLWLQRYAVKQEPQPPQSGFTVSITGVSGDGDNDCSVYDGTDSSGINLGYLHAETKSYQITSGHIYLESAQYSTRTPTVTGGVSLTNLGEFDALFEVTGDGTIGNVGFWCFAEGTLITLADGSRKAVEDITYDDDLLVWNFYEGKFDTAKPTWIMPVKQAPEYNKLTFANGSELKLVGPGGNIGYHRIYNDDAKCFTHTGVPDTQIGCHTFTDDGAFTELVSQEVVKESVNYYNIITEKHYNLFTNGILTSCRLSNQYDIENMKYVGESKMSEQEIAEYLERLER